MNFNIVENAAIEWDIEEIIQDYTNKELSVKQIRKKHGITHGAWPKILKLLKEHNIPLRGYRSQGYVKHRQKYDTYTKNNHIYYDKNLKKYKIIRMIDKQSHYFGVYSTREEAQERVEYLKRNKWNGLLK